MWMARRRAELNVQILHVLDDGVLHGGWEMSRQLRVRSGRMYPALSRLLEDGLIAAEWEHPPPLRRPARRLYRKAVR
jgi:DNA-binding PadR family transcriptional regulator